MIERSQFDDRPPIDVSRFHATIAPTLVHNDHALGWLEITVTHARNAYREMVASDDLEVNARLVGEIRLMLSEGMKAMAGLHETFAAFGAEHRH